MYSRSGVLREVMNHYMYCERVWKKTNNIRKIVVHLTLYFYLLTNWVHSFLYCIPVHNRLLITQQFPENNINKTNPHHHHVKESRILSSSRHRLFYVSVFPWQQLVREWKRGKIADTREEQVVNLFVNVDGKVC